MSPEADARACGRFTRSLAAEAFKQRSSALFLQGRALEAMRDHDELVRHWRDQPGFMDGYVEGSPC